MILLDTNVVSELMRHRPEPKVEARMAGQPTTEFYITATTEAELRYGVEVLPVGQRRHVLQTALAGMLEQDFAGRVLPFNSAAATAYAAIGAERRRLARPISQMDAQIAAIARSVKAPLATRNVADFADCGITLINPWTV